MTRCLRAVMIDLSGTLFIGDRAIPGAVDALERLKSNNLQIRFVTNTTKESTSAMLLRLSSLGFQVNEKELFTSIRATRRVLEEGNFRPYLLVSDEALEEFDGIDTTDPNAVVVGLAPEKLNYEEMNYAFRLLLSENVPLIAIHRGRYYKEENGLSLGPGPFIAALEHALGSATHTRVIGKPNAEFFQMVLKDLNCSPDQAVMIGDDVGDDILGAISTGMEGILVKTGKYRQGDERKITDHASCSVVENFAAAAAKVLNSNSVDISLK